PHAGSGNHGVSTAATTTFGSLGDTAKARPPRPAKILFSISFQVLPPSGDFSKPVNVSDPYTMLGLLGAKAMESTPSEACVSVRGLHVVPASVVCHIPPSAVPISQCDELWGQLPAKQCARRFWTPNRKRSTRCARDRYWSTSMAAEVAEALPPLVRAEQPRRAGALPESARPRAFVPDRSVP